MIHVKQQPDGSYTVKLDAPEKILLRRIGKAYALPLPQAMGSVVLRGIESIGKLIIAADGKKDDTQETEKPDTGGD